MVCFFQHKFQISSKGNFKQRKFQTKEIEIEVNLFQIHRQIFYLLTLKKNIIFEIIFLHGINEDMNIDFKKEGYFIALIF